MEEITETSGLDQESRPKNAALPFETYLDFPSLTMDLPPGKSFFALREAGGRELARLQGQSGRLVTSEYEDRFSDAIRNLKRCTSGADAHYGDLLSCFADGKGSVEAFVSYQTDRFRNQLRRGNDRIVALDIKIDEWIPQVYGRTINRGNNPNWKHFEEISDIRDERHSHPKGRVHADADSQFCRLLNLFRTGIARLLLDLHAITGRGAPPDIVKYAYLPDIEQVDN